MTRSDTMSTYDDDFFTWTQEQADLLRRLPGSDRVDIAHVAEEIEDMGKRDLREVESLLERLLEHLIKMAADPQSRDISHWSSEASHFQSGAVKGFSPGMRQLLDIADIWRLGRRAADRHLRETGSGFEPPRACPLTLDDLLSTDFDVDAAVATFAFVRGATR